MAPNLTPFSGSSAQSTADADILIATELRGVEERRRASGQHIVAYEDSAQLIEPWAGVTNWSTFGASIPAVSGGKLFATTGLEGSVSGLYRSFPLGTAGTGRAFFPINMIAGVSGAGSYIFFGLTSDTGSPAIASPVLANGITCLFNLSTGALGFNWHDAYYDTSDVSAEGILSLPDGGELRAAGTWPATQGEVPLNVTQTIYMDIEVDANWMSFTLRPLNHAWEIVAQIPRSDSPGDNIECLSLGVLDARTSGGASLGTSAIKQSFASVSPHSVGVTDGIENTIDRVVWTQTETTGGSIRVWLPPNYDSRVPTPLIINSHSAGQDENEVYDTPWNTTFQYLVNAGYMVVSCDDDSNAFGNAQVEANTLAAYEYACDHFNIGAVILSGSSMGGIASCNVLAARSIPGIVGMLLFSPAMNMSWLWAQCATGGSYTQFIDPIEAAYDLTSLTDPNYHAHVDPYDPMLHSLTAYRGTRTLIYYGLTDGLVVPADNVLEWVTKYGGTLLEATTISTSGGHLDPQQFEDPATILAFCNRCISS